MVDSGRRSRQPRRRSPVISPVLRPTLWSALLGAVAAMALATPSYADPALPGVVPDSGARPVAAGDLRLPGAVPGYPTPTLPGGVTTLPVAGIPANPLLTRITALQDQNRQLGDRMLELRQQRDDARAQLATAERDLATARDALTKAQERADDVAADAFKAAAALPPGELAADLHGLSVLQRLSRGEQADGATTAAAGELSRARAGEQWAVQALTSAQDRVRRTDGELTAAQATLRASDTELIKLRADNQAQLIQAERQQEAAEQRLGAAYVEGQSSTGLIASPEALAAVRYALAQLGDPYLWSAEGPDRFDCSGLMWAAYRSAGYYDLPRVSRDQYFATRAKTVAPGALLPGDLLFFASGSSWTTIHHVGMYIGGGKMVQAPSTGDFVKISTVRWSGLYAATRVVGAVPGPAIPVPPAPATTGPTTPSPKPSTTPSPRPGATGTTPSRPPTTTPTTPSSTPSTTPSPTPTTPPPATTPPATTPPPPSTEAPAPEPSASETTAAPTPETSSIAPTTAESSSAPETSSSVTASASTGS
ncbi:NlpC/P60 family protein [Micromonospora sp. CPCC 205711]|uniref:C40 family peptidase n=1 Tax=Micromonospora sp. CPCC 205547 TaxID=3122400 RepID=UPI002FEECD68